MNRLPLYAVVAAGGMLLAVGCSSSPNRQAQGEASREAPEATNNTGTAFVRYVSAVDAHSGTDLYFGDLRLFSTADAAKATDYKPVPAERRDFVLRAAAGSPEGVAIEKNSEGLGNGKHYTVLVYEDENAKPVLKVFNDDESAPAAGKAKLRIIDAAPGDNGFSVYVPGRKDKLASESSLSTVSTWQDVDPVRGPIEVRTGSGRTARTVRVPDSGLEAGKLYTLVVEGGSKSGEKLHVVQMTNMPTGS
jgi:hypothetical protein